MQDIPLPVITLSGNRPETLLEEFVETRQALDKFADTFHSMDFHPRNYPLNFHEASVARQVAIENIRGLAHYLDTHIEYLVKLVK